MKKIFISALSLFATTQLFATPPHTWHAVNATQGQWNVSLRVINEPDHAWFVDLNDQKISGFKLSSTSPQKYGFAFDGGADFDVAYTVTLVEQAGASNFTSKTCVYVVTAKGAATPDITPLSYNGANCQWRVNPGTGEDFIVG